ncbi:hypothetical protein SteCoe_36360 [Stentor coeruleus]|uniref:DNA-directed RNA polymerase subunit n=1 Tax=Stentor coeruleus TaxID=5963 RepID=A0A1R2AQF1_9CILI|nr:hypothetical protein SteCoe_36360 [Stentor coeruleus]
MMFCPTCANCLLVEQKITATQFFCKSCPYVFRIRNKVSKRLELQRKPVDDVLGGAEEWANVDQIDVICPKCPSSRAYFKMIQIRSADEPATQFFRCVSCSHRWNEN